MIPPSLTMGRSTAPQSRCFPVIVQLRQEFSSVGSANLESIELYVMVHFERFVEGNRSFWEPYLSSVSYLESSMPM